MSATELELGRIEWPTLALIAACYLIWGICTVVLPPVSMGLTIVVLTVTIALHSSLTHEVVHGHPCPGADRLNALLMRTSLILFVPYDRFRDTHLAHHNDSILTDPYDDPESNYLDPAVWDRLHPVARAILSFNNTLLGRLLVGPLIGTASFLLADLRSMLSGDRAVIRGWLLHVPPMILIGLWLAIVGTVPFWAYLVSVYGAMSLLRIRTFLEHQAHERASGRTVIIEDRGPLSWLFLNNNLHVVHHMHPRIPWYRLPELYREHREHYQRRNGGYVFGTYSDVFRRCFLRCKDPVSHPFYRR